MSSKLYDLVAKSAKATLLEMGYKELCNVEREIYFSFDILAENKEGAELIVSKMVKKTTLFVNPNKDTYKIGRIKSEIRVLLLASARNPKSEIVDVLIWYINDKRGETIRNSLKNQGFERVLSVSQGELWHLFLSQKGLAPSIIKGLLVNPHSQRYEIIADC